MEASRVVTVATGALGPVLAKLTALLGDEYKLPMASRSDIEFIKSELEPVHCLLLKIWEREDIDGACKDWMMDARDLSYAMEDDIDDFMLSQQPGDSGSVQQATGVSIFMDLKIQVLGLVGRCCEKWKDSETSSSTSNKVTVDPRARFLLKNESELLEMEKKKDELIDLLQHHEAVCILGFAGMGKTTLADLVYRAIGETFECRAFVSLSPSPNRMDVLKTIIKHASVPPADTNASDEAISDNIRNFLRDKRYLVVVDDIWHWAEMELIRKSLPKNNLGSRIIMTTRINYVAEKCRRVNDGFIYAIAGLSIDASEALSERIIHESGKVFITSSAKLGTFYAIAKMSGGIPLAVTCMSLAVKEQLPSEDVQDLDPYTEHEHFEGLLNQALEGFLHIQCMKPLVESLYLGYQYLPVHLKTCLLHCSIYSPDQLFERDDVTRIWIAERYVYDEEDAGSYFDELVNSGYIWPGESRCDEVPKYEINPTMLAFLKCQSQKYNFLASVGYFSNNISSLYGRQIHRACVQGGLRSSDMSKLDFTHIRTFVTCGRASLVPFEHVKRLRVLLLDEDFSLENANSGKDDQNLGNDNLGNDNSMVTDELLFPRPRHPIRTTCEIQPSIRSAQPSICSEFTVLQPQIEELQPQIGKLQYLETLYVSSKRIRQLPREIGKLHRLNTLNVSMTNITGLPRKIEELKLLKTLIMSNTKLKELPKVIGKLQILKTLDVSNTAVTSLPKDIGNLQLLKTLNMSHTKIEKVPVEIGKLQHLKILDISNTAVRELPRSIWELQLLKSLNLGKTNIERLPEGIGELKDLENLDVSNTLIAELPRETWELQLLRTLNLSNTKVTKIAREIGNLKDLRTMDISSTHVTELPREIGKLTSLETLDLSRSDVKELPWEASRLSETLVVFVGATASRQMVNLPKGMCQPATDNSILPSNLSIMLSGRSGMNWEPLPLARFKVARHVNIPSWVKGSLSDISSLDISVWKLEDSDLEFLRGMPYLRTLVIQFELLPRKIITISGGGFTRLESFHVDYRLPWVTFQPGAMPNLRCLEFKFYACQPTEGTMGIRNLQNLQRVVFQSVSLIYRSDAPGIRTIIDKVREEAREHPNRITLCIDGKKEVIQKMCADEEKNINGAGSSSGASATEKSLPDYDKDGYKGSEQRTSRQLYSNLPKSLGKNKQKAE